MKSGMILAACLLLASLAFAQDQPIAISQVFAFACNQSFTSCPDGFDPSAPFLRLPDGNLYGVTWWAGKGNANAGGTVFKLTPQGTITVLHTFQPGLSGKFPGGENPVIGLAQGPDGFLYGVTEQGGTHNAGVMYKVSTTGTGFRVLHNFCSVTNCVDGAGAITLGRDGNFYGIEYHTFFRITPSGSWTLLHNLDPTTEGQGGGTLLLASDGNFYGTGSIANAIGTIYRITPQGEFTLLFKFSFCGFGVTSNLTQAKDGNIYGATNSSGPGTGIFRLTLPNTVEFIHQMTDSEGYSPVALFQASDGNLWGISDYRNGSLFAVSINGTSLQSAPFTCATDGCTPGALLQGKDGTLYGTAINGGNAPNLEPLGTVFKVNAGLPPAQ